MAAGARPVTFTPYTWVNGRETDIRLTAPDSSVRVIVYRRIAHRRLDNEIALDDEAYMLEPGETADGNHDISPFRYTFDLQGKLTKYDPSLAVTERVQRIVTALSSLVSMPGATISARNYTVGQESSFTSDGTQWYKTNSGLAVPTRPALATGQLAIDPPIAE